MPFLQKNRLKPAVALFNLAEANLRQYPEQHEHLEVVRVRGLIADWRGRVEAGGFAVNPLPVQRPPELQLIR